MKKRDGFVSNSSSSSFIIASKEKLSQEILSKVLGVPDNGLFKDIAEEMVDIFYKNSEEMTAEELVDNYGYDSIEEFQNESGGEFIDFIKEAINSGFYLYIGSVGDENGGAEYATVSMDINYKDPTFMMWKEAYY